MATGNGKGSVLPGLLDAVVGLRGELHAHIEATDQWFQGAKERFGRMDQNLARMARLITALAGTIEDHETRLRHLEGR